MPREHLKQLLLNDISQYQKLFESAYDSIFLLHHGFFVDCNEAAVKTFHLNNKDEVYHLHPSQISPQFQPDGQSSEAKANNMIQQCLENGSNRFEWMHSTVDGFPFWAEVTLIKMKLHDQDVVYAVVRNIEAQKETETRLLTSNRELRRKNKAIQDVNNELKQATDTHDQLLESITSLNEYKKALDESSIVSKTDHFGKITYANELFCKVSGYSPEELIGQSHNIIRHPSTPVETFKDLWNTIQDKRVWKGVLKNRAKDGKAYYVSSTIFPIMDSQNNIKEFIAIRQDVTSLYEKDAIIDEQYTDQLTALKNRIKLKADMDKVPLPKLAIMNIDRFKDINDSYGQELGDLLLIKFAQKLQRLSSHNVRVYRYGGDEFAILAFGHYGLPELEMLCRHFIADLTKQNLKVDDNYFNISVSVGMAERKEQLLTSVEMALSHAKHNAIDLVVFNEDLDMRNELRENIEWTKRIKFAIQNQGILLFGQKIISNENQREKFETLMRLEDESGKLISPYFFLEHAKRARLYPSLTRIIVEQACQFFSGKECQFSLNLTIQDILNSETVAFILQRLQETDTCEQVIIELVESEGIENYEAVTAFIKQIKTLGGKVAIDDFGTGYSNFEYLTKIDVDFLKIDGSLIRNIHQDRNMYITVKTIVSFAKELDIKLIAEFVHCKEVQDIISELGIDMSQGYYFHEPELLMEPFAANC